MKTLAINLKKWLLPAVAIMAISAGHAQGVLDSLSQDDSKIVSAIAPYAADMRAAILDVSQYPQALVKLERVQARSSQSFQDLIQGYPREEQEKFYQTTRFPELVSQLVAMGKGNIEQVKTAIKDYPEGPQPSIIDVYRDHFDDLARINSMYQTSQSAMERITSRYTPQVQDDFKKIIGSPDVMNLLTDNIDLTVTLGESYGADPRGVLQYLDSLNAKLTDQNAKDLESYKSEVESDPKLQAEMKSAAYEFAKQYDQTEGNPTTVNNNYYGSSPYPYWFGYPYWYNSPMWYPTPFYYNTGFYIGMNGLPVVVGLPSFAYANWFFGFGYNRYPGLYRHYNTYYNVHRTNITNVNVYRGFNTATRNHFGAVNRNPQVHPNGRVNGPNVRTDMNRSRGVAPAHNNNQPFRQPMHNNANFNHYNAGSYHSMGWQGARPAGGGGGFHGGGMRGGRH